MTLGCFEALSVFLLLPFLRRYSLVPVGFRIYIGSSGRLW